MNLNLVKFILFTSLVGLLSSCSEYSKILKSEDPDLKYDKALEYFEAEKYSKTIALLNEISYIYSSTPREDSIAYYTATSEYKSGDMATSGTLFNNFRHKYKRSIFLEEAEYMYAKGFYFSSPDPTRDQTETVKAIMAIQEYLERYPNSAKKDALMENIGELTRKLHDKSFLNAKTYYKIGKYKSAVVALKNASREFPESKHQEELFYLVVKSNYLFASKSYVSLQRDRYLDMMDAYYTFVSDYPESEYLKELDKMMLTAKKYIDQFKETATTDESKDKPKKDAKDKKTKRKKNKIKNDKIVNTESNDGN